MKTYQQSTEIAIITANPDGVLSLVGLALSDADAMDHAKKEELEQYILLPMHTQKLVDVDPEFAAEARKAVRVIGAPPAAKSAQRKKAQVTGGKEEENNEA